MNNQIFQTLKELPISPERSQCVLHKHEQKACHSYHTIKNEHKFICEYTNDVYLNGHCVAKLVDNNKDSNQIILLSFGGQFSRRHTLIMKYVNVWSNILNNSNNYNEWVPFTDNQNHLNITGRYQDNYYGVRTVIGRSNNNLLFIIYRNNNII
ncbi:hypothetical protein RFI_09023, partial [Reticulomyxa filosa]